MMKKPWLVHGIWIAPMALIIGFLCWLRIPASYRALHLLEQALDRDRLCCSLVIKTDSFEAGGTISWREMGNGRYYTMDFSGETIYFHHGSVWFSKGNGYNLTEAQQDLGIPDALPLWPILLAGFEKAESGEGYQLRLDGWRKEALAKLLADVPHLYSALEDGTMILTADQGILGTLTVIGKDFTVTVQILDTQPEPIPTDLLMEMNEPASKDIRILQPLYHACRELLTRERVTANLHLEANCGPLSILDTLQCTLTDQGLVFHRDGDTSNLNFDLLTAVLGLGWMLCRDGEWIAGTDDSGTFSLDFSGMQLEKGVFFLLPELAGSGIQLGDARFSAVIESGTFHKMELQSTGVMPLLISQVPLSIRLELNRT